MRGPRGAAAGQGATAITSGRQLLISGVINVVTSISVAAPAWEPDLCILDGPIPVILSCGPSPPSITAANTLVRPRLSPRRIAHASVGSSRPGSTSRQTSGQSKVYIDKAVEKREAK